MVVKLIKRFDIIGSTIAILDYLFQQTCNEIGNRLLDLFFIVAIDTRYRNVVALEDFLEVVYHN